MNDWLLRKRAAEWRDWLAQLKQREAKKESK